MPGPASRSSRIAYRSRSATPDALVSAWIADRYLFPNEQCRVEFISRTRSPSRLAPYDCVVDVGNTYDPAKLHFDHKPPAFTDRDEHCASSLVWQHAMDLQRPVSRLKRLVNLVHDGDAKTRRNGSADYQHSRTLGLHAVIKHARAYSQSDRMLYQAIAACLDGRPSWWTGRRSRAR